MSEARIQNILAHLAPERPAFSRGQTRLPYTLDRLKEALAYLGNPEKSAKSLIIGGTNGKGSTTLFISAGLKSAGFKVHTFLSPHLSSVTERFLENLEPVDAGSLASSLESYWPVAQKFSLSYFEFLTLVSFMRAKEAQVDFLVLEVGLGGRLDATNLCDPIASVISNIGLDHQEILGTDLPSILKEKLGIVRSEGLLFTGVSDPQLINQIEAHCLEIDAIAYYSRELRAEVIEKTLTYQKARINGYPFELSNPSQTTLENAKTALLALRILFPKYPVETFANGFKKVLLPARFEVLQEAPLTLISGDHNPQAMESLLKTLKLLPKSSRLFVLAAFSADKDFSSMIPALKKKAHQFLLTYIPGSFGKMPEKYLEYGPIHRPYSEILEEITSQMQKEDVLLITGSLYLAGEVRSFWSPRVQFQLDEKEVLERYNPSKALSNPAIPRTGAKAQKLVLPSEGEAPLLRRNSISVLRTQANLNL